MGTVAKTIAGSRTRLLSVAAGARAPGSPAPRRAPRVAFALLVLFWGELAWASEPPHVPVPGGLGGKTCYACHIKGRGIVLPSEERPRKYSIASAWATYAESPHGRLRAMGDPNAPMCEDCHLTREWSYILSQEHPQSPVHPANLPAVCARCHGRAMLSADVASGSMHLQLRAAALVPGKPLHVRFGFLPGITKRESSYFLGPFNVTAYVYYFFLALTVGTLVSMAAYMVLDLARRLIERRGQTGGNS